MNGDGCGRQPCFLSRPAFRRRRWPGLAIVIAVLLIGFVVAGCGGREVRVQTVTTTVPAEPTAVTTTATTTTASTPESPEELAARVRSGVIRIEATTCDGEGVGSGFLLSPRLVATVEHVIDGAQRVLLKSNGRLLGTATVIGADPARDLALLRTSVPLHGHALRLAERPPRLGEAVVAFGYPLGLPLSVTRGIVSGSDRTIAIDGVKRRKLVQTDAALNPGNSGGPLVDPVTAKVLGLVDLGSDFNGLSFAVSAQVAQPLLRAGRSRPNPKRSPIARAPRASPAPRPPNPPTHPRARPSRRGRSLKRCFSVSTRLSSRAITAQRGICSVRASSSRRCASTATATG